jgi:hypothetical protein
MPYILMVDLKSVEPSQISEVSHGSQSSLMGCHSTVRERDLEWRDGLRLFRATLRLYSSCGGARGAESL